MWRQGFTDRNDWKALASAALGERPFLLLQRVQPCVQKVGCLQEHAPKRWLGKVQNAELGYEEEDEIFKTSETPNFLHLLWVATRSSASPMSGHQMVL